MSLLDDLKALAGDEIAVEMDAFIDEFKEDGEKFMKLAAEELKDILTEVAKSDHLSIKDKLERAEILMGFKYAQALARMGIAEIKLAEKGSEMLEKITKIAAKAAVAALFGGA